MVSIIFTTVQYHAHLLNMWRSWTGMLWLVMAAEVSDRSTTTIMFNHREVFESQSRAFPSRTYVQLESDLLVLEWGRWAAASCCKPKVGLWKRRPLRRSSFCFMAARLLHSWTNFSTCGGKGHDISLHIQFQPETENRWSLHLQHKLMVWILEPL